MPNWRDGAIILAVRRFGEDASVVTLLAEKHGRHAGLVRGGQSRKLRPVLQPGNHVMANWRARLYDHLGYMTLELLEPYAARLFDNPLKLASVAAMCALIQVALAEREPAAQVYDATRELLTVLVREADDLAWLPAYIRWEVGILAAAGFGLALDKCAVTGEGGNLAYVSPRTGAAVTKAAAGKHVGRLLVLPGFLGGVEKPLGQDVAHGMQLTAHFIARRFFSSQANDNMASPRQRLHAMVEARYASNES